MRLFAITSRVISTWSCERRSLSSGARNGFKLPKASEWTRQCTPSVVFFEELKKTTDGVHCLVHSLAFGSLKPFLAPEDKDRLSQDQVEMTLDVMANSLIYWTQDLFSNKLLRKGSRIFAMTSAGGQRVWHSY